MCRHGDLSEQILGLSYHSVITVQRDKRAKPRMVNRSEHDSGRKCRRSLFRGAE